jgi:hypothetical protein
MMVDVIKEAVWYVVEVDSNRVVGGVPLCRVV